MSSVERADRLSAAIRTPDQRLRVFISSTLVEMAQERASARAAVETLRLAPVMFELGARPHPPRDLYRAYLEQSDVFVGLYWERYGWVAPTETISGLEDEYNLAGDLPRLIYVKQTTEPREPRLVELLARIRNDDRASYKYFSTPEELAELIEADLATLLAERFDQSRMPRPAPTPTTPIDLPGAMPATLDTLIGRDRELRAITGMLADSRVHLVTLTGPGGTGKSRLAIDSARQSIPEFRDGVYFVGLAAVQNPDDVTATIARTIGVRDSGDALIADKLALALRHRHILLVLDNFEQVLSAAAGITALLAAAPDVTALVTSRSPLRVRGEHVFNVDPLGLPEENESTLEFAGNFSAIELFVERARAAKPDFELTETNVADVARICRALDGLPLALELVAARIRLLPPAAMIERLDRQLGSLVGRGIRDLPTRQQTLLSTVTWSTDLLAPDEVHLLKRLGVFSGGFSLEAAESIATESERDVLTVLESLVDSSLVRQQDSDSEPHFTMLATVREWARDRLRDEDALDETCDRQASYYLALSKRLGPLLIGPEQLRVSRALAGEHENVVRSVARLIETGKTDDAAQLAWNLYTYWWVAGHLGEVSRQMTTMLSTGLPLGDHARAVALYFTRAINFWRDPDLLVVPGLAESSQLFERSHDPSGEALARISLALGLLACETPDPDRAAAELSTALERFRSIDDQWGEALTLVTIGRISILSGDTVGALTQFEASLQLARSQKDDLGEGIALNHIGWAHFLLGNTTAGAEAFAQSLDLSILLGHTEGIAYGLEGFVAIAAALGQVTNAGTLMGAAQSLRRTTGLYNSPTFSFHEQAVVRILASEAADEFQQARRDGQRMRLPEAIELAQRIEAE